MLNLWFNRPLRRLQHLFNRHRCRSNTSRLHKPQLLHRPQLLYKLRHQRLLPVARDPAADKFLIVSKSYGISNNVYCCYGTLPSVSTKTVVVPSRRIVPA